LIKIVIIEIVIIIVEITAIIIEPTAFMLLFRAQASTRSSILLFALFYSPWDSSRLVGDL
jgi:hypothetical protein